MNSARPGRRTKVDNKVDVEALSAAIAAELAKGASLPEAVASAKAYVTAAIFAADGLDIGKGRGPVHHFHDWWEEGR